MLAALCLLALGTWAWREACRRSEALAYVESMEGLASFAATSGSREWLRVPRCWQAVDGLHFETETDLDLRRIEPLHELKWLWIRGGRIDDAGLRSIATFPRLEQFVLVSMQITGSFRHLSRCRHLQELRIGSSMLADEALEGAGEWTVSDLSFYGTPLTDAGLRHLAGLRLRSLVLDKTRVTGTGLDVLSAPLEMLSLDEAPVDDAGLARLAPISTRRDLYLSETQITGTTLAHLANVPLELLTLENAPVTDAGAAAIAQCRSLKHITLTGTHITDAGLAELARMPVLESLELNKTQVTDAGCRHLGQLPLTSLGLNQTSITDAVLPLLASRPLITIDLIGTRVTPQGCECCVPRRP